MLGIRDRGREVIGMPSASRTSALPEADDEARAPCYCKPTDQKHKISIFRPSRLAIGKIYLLCKSSRLRLQQREQQLSRR